MLGFMVFIIFLGSLLEQGSSALASETKSEELANYRSLQVGFLLASRKEERYQYDEKFFRQSAKRHRADLWIASAHNDMARQHEIAQQWLLDGIDLLVLQAVDSDKAASIVSLYRAQGVPVIAYDRAIPHAGILSYLSHDNRLIGRLQVEQLLDSLPRGGRILVCAGPKDQSVAEEITQANLEVASRKGFQIQVVYNQEWSRLRCMAAVLRALAGGELHAILANNSQMADGAVAVLKKKGISPGEILVAGADGSSQACRNMIAGYQQADVHKPIEDLVRATWVVVNTWRRDHKLPLAMRSIRIPVESMNRKLLPRYFMNTGSTNELPTCKKSEW